MLRFAYFLPEAEESFWQVIIRYSSDEATLQRTKMCLGKLNLILVQVLVRQMLAWDTRSSSC